MMQGKLATVEIRGRTITARELSVAEVRQWLKDVQGEHLDSEEFDAVGEFLLDVSFSDIQRMTDIDDAGMNDLFPSEIEEVTKAVKACNPFFFALRDKLIGKETAPPASDS